MSYKIYTDANSKLALSPTGLLLVQNEIVPSETVALDGLVCWLDGADYSGSGNWMDKTINGKNGVVSGSGVTYSTDNGGKLIFSGGSGVGCVISGLDFTSSSYTLMGAAHYVSALTGRIFSNDDFSDSNYAAGWWGGYCEVEYSSGWVVSPSGPQDTNWRIMTTFRDVENSIALLSINNTPLTSSYTGAGMHDLAIGSSGQYGGEPANCEVGFVLVYNRILTSTEIIQNYNYYKDRYGV